MYRLYSHLLRLTQLISEGAAQVIVVMILPV